MEQALHYFWLRVVKSILHSETTLTDFADDHPSLKRLNNLTSVRKWTTNYFGTDLFHSKRGVLICVDEFSKVTDALNVNSCSWSSQQKKDFMNAIHGEKLRFSEERRRVTIFRTEIVKYPFFVQFLFTGFNKDMPKLLHHSSEVKSYTLSMCDFSNSKPLLSKIVGSYKDEKLIIPANVFECVKCTPGLVGLWAELVKKKIFPNDLSSFRKEVVWLQAVSSKPLIEDSWKLIIEYLELIARPTDELRAAGAMYDGMAERLVDAEIGTSGDDGQCPIIVPICLVLISLYMKSSGIISQRSLREKYLQDLLTALIDVLQQTNVLKKDGAKFESFILHALRLRLALQKEEMSAVVKVRLSFFLPGNCFEGFVDLPSGHRQNYFLHEISSKSDLQNFLLSPIYNLFPVGWVALQKTQTQSQSLQRWIASHEPQKHRKYTGSDHYGIFINETLKGFGKDAKNNVLLELCPREHFPVSIELLEKFFCFLSDLDTEQMDNALSSKKNLRHLINEFFLTGYSNTEAEFKEKLTKWWTGMVDRVFSLARCFVNPEASFVCVPDSNQGCDLLMVWTEEDNISADIDDETPDNAASLDAATASALTIVHIAAIEIKDRRFTESVEWSDKMEILLSLRCLIWWMQIIYRRKFDIRYHIVFAGREHEVVQ